MQHNGGVSSLKIEEEAGLEHSFVWELFSRWNLPTLFFLFCFWLFLMLLKLLSLLMLLSLSSLSLCQWQLERRRMADRSGEGDGKQGEKIFSHHFSSILSFQWASMISSSSPSLRRKAPRCLDLPPLTILSSSRANSASWTAPPCQKWWDIQCLQKLNLAIA